MRNAGRQALCCKNLGFADVSCDGRFAEYVDLLERMVFKCEPSTPFDGMLLRETFAIALHALAKIKLNDGSFLIIGSDSVR